MSDTTGLASFAHEGVLVSALLPEGWEVTELAPNQVRFFGPRHPEHDDYQPTFSITLGQPEGFGDEWFDQLCADSLERLRSNYEGFELRDTERFALSSLVDVNAVWFEWQPEPGLAFAQVQALAAVDAFRLYLINAATLLPLADTYLPVFDRILHDLRLLPPR